MVAVPKIYVNMFGEFSLHTDNAEIRETDSRSRKVWLLLAYLLFHHARPVKPGELMSILWPEGEKAPGALKTLLYRVRTELDKLWEGAGKELILFRQNGYIWNSDIPLQLDCEEFDRHYDTLAASGESSTEETVALLDLYRGDFLTHFSTELWVTPHAVYYHNLYIESLLGILPVLEENRQFDDMLRLCRAAAAGEPFHEGIHCCLMKAYIGQKKYKEAMEVYTELRDRFQSELGVVPSEEIRSIYAEAARCGSQHILNAESLRENLNEKDSLAGALICDYDFFRVLYQSMARSVLRSGIAVHLALLTMKGRRVEITNEKRWEKLSAHLEETIRHSLRRGDSAAACTTSQYVIMLPQANYENSCRVCERIISGYYKKVSRLDIDINYEVFPIQPDSKENYQWIREPDQP